MSEQPERQRPSTDDRNAWRAYWAVQGMTWRTEPEIGEERQAYLAERRAVTPDMDRGVYPFRDEIGSIELTRADVEWLLATHESGGMRGPVDWGDAEQQGRDGVDLRGADLQRVNLSSLPLTHLRGGIPRQAWFDSNSHQREAAAVHLEEAILQDAHLEDAQLRAAHLEGAYLRGAHLAGAELVVAHLEGASLFNASLKGEAVPATASPHRARGKPGRVLVRPPADIHLAFFSDASSLASAHLGDRQLGGIRIADVRWNGMNLGRATWRNIEVLGDEVVARQPLQSNGEPKEASRRLQEHHTMVRAYRQLAIILRELGDNEDADRFAYRAQMLQRGVLRREGQWGRALGSWLLDVLAGYGYKPLRSVLTYVVIVSAFAGLYLLNAQFAAPHLRWDEALVLSISSFHGRGFFTTGISLGDTLARLAAAEAIIGLLIEITFIATFTQRFFAR
jgi:uncharacterized protein YjbI with pentapeptide repeats